MGRQLTGEPVIGHRFHFLSSQPPRFFSTIPAACRRLTTDLMLAPNHRQTACLSWPNCTMSSQTQAGSWFHRIWKFNAHSTACLQAYQNEKVFHFEMKLIQCLFFVGTSYAAADASFTIILKKYFQSGSIFFTFS